MKQILIKQGKAVVDEVPAPLVEPGTILVQTHYSCVSTGTELSGITVSAIPLWMRGIRRPEKVKKAFQMVANYGFDQTRTMLQGRLSAGEPTGYSATGVVTEVGEGIDDIRPGDRVACAGSQCAHHAEIIRVPRNLTVPIPENLDFAIASTVALGAIALQGVRRAQPTLGETFVVIGLGILGQLTAQILKVNGCRVIATDLDPERIRLAEELGVDIGINPENGNNIEDVANLTDGIGADGVIITAASASDKVVSTAFKMCRKKGRVVLVGDVGLNLNRADFYQKEIDFFISSSYGPGRYDKIYEEKSLDYPVSYVRWTENRNMAEYLRLVADGKVKASSLISATYSIDQAAVAYEALKNEGARPLAVLISYPQPDAVIVPSRTVCNPTARPAKENRIRIAVVGAGNFAKATHIPNLLTLSDFYHLQAIVTRTGHNATATARQFGANYATTDYQQILNDPEVDAVLIATRHNLHASMALEALKAGKHVLVEKPLALTQNEIDEITAHYDSYKSDENNPILLAGFNRRFSRFARRIHELTAARRNPMILNYRMNAGYIPLDHWVHTEEGGGRNRGEACHIYDLFTYLTSSKIVEVNAHTIRPSTGYYSHRDNFLATLDFQDGSIATLTYTALGAKEYPKEQMEVYVDGKVLFLDDYKRLIIAGGKTEELKSMVADKGHKKELKAFADAIQQGGQWPIPLWEQVQATEIAFQVEAQLGSGGQVSDEFGRLT